MRIVVRSSPLHSKITFDQKDRRLSRRPGSSPASPVDDLSGAKVNGLPCVLADHLTFNGQPIE